MKHTAQNESGLGSKQRDALRFARLYTRESWHSFNQDSDTKRVIQSLAARGLVEINEFNQFRLSQIIPLTQESIDAVFDAATQQSDYLIGLYRIAFPFWDDSASVDGYPVISHNTAGYISQRAIEFDKANHPGVVAGGLVLNNGFSTLSGRRVPDWHVLPCEYTLVGNPAQ